MKLPLDPPNTQEFRAGNHRRDSTPKNVASNLGRHALYSRVRPNDGRRVVGHVLNVTTLRDGNLEPEVVRDAAGRRAFREREGWRLAAHARQRGAFRNPR